DAHEQLNKRDWELRNQLKLPGLLAEDTSPFIDFSAKELVECPNCRERGVFTEARAFNLMFKTFVGPVEESANEVYLRPETAQAMFTNFDNVVTSMRRKLPFGIAQIGKSFRNEITPGNFIFRDREFEVMETEYFCKPGTDDEWHAHWIETRLEWHKRIGVRPEKLRIRPHEQDELSHYSKATSDIEYHFDAMGWSELEGVANRTDFDLKQHAEYSGKSLTYFDEESKEHILPYVIEPALGVDRCFLVLLYDAYREEEVGGEKRVYLSLHPTVAPIKVAVLPLSRNERLTPLARQVYDKLRPRFMTQFDDAQSIGRRYRRQDEIGTPLCVTVDFDSLEDNAVTIRERDTMTQTRVRIEELVTVLGEKLSV
ncbi:MAG TPA: glycine--tRNA ligase, partial [Dehalococcoidia bacterium]|nr:glycine--tRNA ligase [Dehalococcoidia bacterium]